MTDEHENGWLPAELESPEEAAAMNAACGVWQDGPGRDPEQYTPLAGFWEGWLAGRDWAREAAARREAQLRAALEKSIRSHENLLEFRIIPDRYRDECHAIIENLRAALAEQPAPTTGAEGGPAERWIVDQRDHGAYFLKTASGTVVREGLSQRQARQVANEHNGDQEYPDLVAEGGA